MIDNSAAYEKKFSAALEKLNPQQKLAVDTLEGPVLVFAGPGTGKTQVLTLRIANLLAQGLAEPQNILALTFTKAAAANMKERLATFVGPMAYQVNINTFHGFCQDVIEAHGEFFPLRHDSQVLDELTRYEIMEKILLSLPLTILQPAGDKLYYLKKLTDKIDQLKSENITPDKYQELLEAERRRVASLQEAELAKKRPSQSKITTWQKTLKKQEEILLVYQAYCQELQKQNLYDYTDMILWTIQAWQNNADLLADYEEQYQYLLVDEYQDTNNAQSEILRLLMAHWQDEQPNIFVVGDAQQSIYRFQGANLENFLRFQKDYPQTRVISLDTGYRCSDKIYQLAHHLMCDTDLKDAATLLKNFECRAGEPVTLTACQSADSEIIEIIKQIKDLQKTQIPLEKIAVIFRQNNEAARLLELFAQYGVPVEIEGGIDVLQQNIIEQLLQILRFLTNFSDQESNDFLLAQIIWQPWFDLPALPLIKLLQKAQAERSSIFELLLNTSEPALQKFVQLLVTWQKSVPTMSVTELVQKILQESNLLTWINEQPNRIHLLTYLYTWQSTLSYWQQQQKTPLTLNSVLAKVDLMQNHHLKMIAQDLNVRAGAVSFTTAHKAKGREWDYVFIYGFGDHNWHKKKREYLPLPAGILQEQDPQEDEAENRRLFFVALTRAKVQTRISWHLSETGDMDVAPKLPSSFVYQLQEKQEAGLVIDRPPALTAEQANQELEKLLQPPAEIDFDSQARAFLRQQVQNLIISPSLLNDYLEDPQLFLQRYLLKMPSEPMKVEREFGNSLHLALEKYYQPRTQGGDFLPLEQVQQIFQADFSVKNLPETDRKNYLQIGLDSLTEYANNYQPTDAETRTLAVEKKFGYQKYLTVDDARLGGKIDRLDLLTDNCARVLDYKSGKAQTENELLGKTKKTTLSEREKTLPPALQNRTMRQLLFYKLLCQLAPDFPYTIEYGVIDFVKKTASSKPVRRQFSLPDEQVEQLKKLIKEVWQEIKDLRFLENN
ncbi:MAG: ATP-dependent DNA helicase [bacterium]|nr:ATP-dependent DNA helicase [bacterium]